MVQKTNKWHRHPYGKRKSPRCLRQPLRMNNCNPRIQSDSKELLRISLSSEEAIGNSRMTESSHELSLQEIRLTLLIRILMRSIYMRCHKRIIKHGTVSQIKIIIITIMKLITVFINLLRITQLLPEIETVKVRIISVSH